ncbi:hypothetical protein BKA63DRAFT_74302 [Paraphoma chrysanthemicola]|nr:hypothetical protein BKA63DRAFT_74302 [Paraphoma chrysanthemicola]
MTGSECGSNGAEPPSASTGSKRKCIQITINTPRRKLTLITITILLNVLHLSALACLFTSVWQIILAPNDSTSLPSEILTLISVIATFFYTGLHTIISYKQKLWIRQRRHQSAIKRTEYIALRVAISLCVLWLLTCGWNMIIVARRPVCAIEAPGLQPWEFGLECRISRASMAFAMVNLVASFALFFVLAIVRRPFEAHLFKHGYQPPVDPFATPIASRDTSPVRNTSEKRLRDARRSTSTRRTPSIISDMTSLDLSDSPTPPIIHAPSPRRSVGLGIFTSELAPPPIPAEWAPRVSSVGALPPVSHASASHPSLTLPPRLSGALPSSAFIPMSVAPQFSASTWRALYPTDPPSRNLASRSQPHRPHTAFSYRSRYSRSSVSLTRPRRLSSATPAGSVDWTSRSGSTGLDGRDTASIASGDDKADSRASAQDVAFATMNGTPISGTTRPKMRGQEHARTTSEADATLGAEQPPQVDRMAMGWKPQLTSQVTMSDDQDLLTVPATVTRIVKSSSADLLSRFSPDSSPDNNDKTPRRELDRNIDMRARVMKELPFRRSRSDSYMSQADATAGATSVEEAAAAMVRNMPQDLKLLNVPQEVQGAQGRVLHSEVARKKSYDEVKNKPLPKIAVL